MVKDEVAPIAIEIDEQDAHDRSDNGREPTQIHQPGDPFAKPLLATICEHLKEQGNEYQSNGKVDDHGVKPTDQLKDPKGVTFHVNKYN